MRGFLLRSLRRALVMALAGSASFAFPAVATEGCLAPFDDETRVFSPADGEADVPRNATPLVQRGFATGSFSLRVGDVLVPFHEEVSPVSRGDQHEGDELTRIIPDDAFPPQSEVELLLDGERLVAFSVGDVQDETPPDAPSLEVAAPSRSGRLCPGFAVLTVDQPSGARLVIAGANRRPTVGDSINGLATDATLVVATSPGNEVPVFAAALDVAGNMSAMTTLDDVKFEEESGPIAASCAQAGGAGGFGVWGMLAFARWSARRRSRAPRGARPRIG